MAQSEMQQSTTPIVQHIPDFLDWLDIEKGLSDTSQRNYERFLTKFREWLVSNDLQDLKPHELSPTHLWEYRVYLARATHRNGRRLTRSTQNHYLTALRQLLKYFAARNINALPAEKVQLPKNDNDKHVRFLALDQVRALMNVPDTGTTKGLRDRAILETLFSTGMRIGELVALNREQVQLGPHTEDLEVVIVGKGNKPRTVYFSARAVTWLRRYLATRDDTFHPLFINYSTQKGATRRLSARSIENMVKRYALAAGLPDDTTPHVLRHSFATNLLAEGVDTRVVQEFLGHSSITATQIYTHVTSKRLRDIHRRYHTASPDKESSSSS